MLNYGPAVLIIFSVFVGILTNRRDVNALKEDVRRQFDGVNRQFDDVNRRFDDVNRRFDDVRKQFDDVNRRLVLIETDQKQFFTITGKLDGRIDEIARR